MFDDFTPTERATITSVSWEGRYCVPNPTLWAGPNIAAFFLWIQEDQMRPPRSRYQTPAPPTIYSVQVPISSIREELDSSVSEDWCSPGVIYSYTYAFQNPPLVNAGTRYWIGMQPVYSRDGTTWLWRIGQPQNRMSYALVALEPHTFPSDQAFSISGMTAPGQNVE